ncbi:MAG: tyrosine-type recombinase/integrase, partial [Chloroflexi bacterium]|nr:tyrosine-type recombinase/integrase [Chloroflexota bacterium]
MLWQQFERSKRAEGLKDKTLREYYRDCEAFATWAEHTYGQRFKVDKPMLDHYMANLSKTDLSAHRRYNILTALKSFYDWCENEGIRDNPARKIKYPKLPSKTVDTYQQSEIDRVLPLLNNRDALMVRLFLGTGLRAMEMQELEVRDIQLDQRQIHIRKAKMDKEGFVPIPDDLMHDIAHHIARKAPKDKLIGVCKDRMWHIWDNACKKAGVIPRGLHVMRHTWACDMLLAGISAYDLMHLGRWTDMKMVERYAANVST